MGVERIDWYLQWGMNIDAYVNTDKEEELVNKFSSLYSIAKGAKEHNSLASSENVTRWRKAYYGVLGALREDGTESEVRGRTINKLVYEFVESKIDNNIPEPHMKPKYKSDIPLVQVTEDYLKYKVDDIFSKYLNDRSERATYVDGTSWYKVWWDSLDNHYCSSGTPKVEVKLVDQIVPQPGIIDWRKLEYIFELEQVPLARIWDLYHRRITPVSNDASMTAKHNEQADLSTITVITCYYLNEERIVGKFSWADHSRQVICNEKDWQIRKLRTCTKCGHIVPQAPECPVCGNKSFRYKNAEKEILSQDLKVIYNPYDVGETDDESKKDEYKVKNFLTAGTEIPYYVVRQLPFIPRPAVSSIESLYGISEASILLDSQDVSNKMYTKIVDKTLDSGAVLTKPNRVKINNTGGGIKQVDVRSYEESQMVQLKQIQADTSQDIIAANLMRENAKAASGVTESFQGKYDASATSGKAKEFSAMQAAGRLESLRVMKAAAFSGLYELVFKYLLAFSDDTQKFVKVLPDGNVKEEEWNKYMFLDKDEYGNIYYRDDFKFSSDPAATLATNRVAMWQEINSQFMQGAFGNITDTRTLKLYWNAMDMQQYPLAKLVLAGIKDNEQHLPPEIERLIMQNPQVLQEVISKFQQASLVEGAGSGGQGGARVGAGREGNGASHAGNVERTNLRNKAADREFSDAVQGTETGGTIE